MATQYVICKENERENKRVCDNVKAIHATAHKADVAILNLLRSDENSYIEADLVLMCRTDTKEGFLAEYRYKGVLRYTVRSVRVGD